MTNTTDNKHYPNISGFTRTILSVTEPCYQNSSTSLASSQS